MTDDAAIEAERQAYVRAYLAGKLTAGEFALRLATDAGFRTWFRGQACADLEADALARLARQKPRQR